MTTITQDVIIYDSGVKKHRRLGTTDKIGLTATDAVAGTSTFDSATGVLTTTFNDGSSATVNLGTLSTDKFLQSATIVGTDLVLTMTDATVFTVPLGDLVPVVTQNTSTVQFVGDGASGAPLQANVVVSTKTPQLLKSDATGLYVDPQVKQASTAPASLATEDGTLPTTIMAGVAAPTYLLGEPKGFFEVFDDAGVSLGKVPYYA